VIYQITCGTTLTVSDLFDTKCSYYIYSLHLSGNAQCKYSSCLTPHKSEREKYEDRACCDSGGTIPSESCPPFKLGGGATAGIVIGSVVFLGVSFFFLNKYMRLCRRARNNNKEQDDVPTKHSNDTAAPKLYESAIQPYEGMSMMLPPSAPPTNPKFDVKE